MAALCERCSKPVKYPGYELCWRCYMGEQLLKQYQRGYLAGASSRQLRAPREQLDAKRLRQLLQLCHPDRHGNSPVSNEVTAWLNRIRDGDD